MTPPKAKPPKRAGKTEELTPATLEKLRGHAQALSRQKPRQTETILKLARAQLAINKALEPFEQARADLLATLPMEPTADADNSLKEAYQKAKDEVDEKFREIYLKGKFSVTFPLPLSNAELQQFTEPPNPIDLVGLHPHIVNIEDE
jgi:hypothetical protein